MTDAVSCARVEDACVARIGSAGRVKDNWIFPFYWHWPWEVVVSQERAEFVMLLSNTAVFATYFGGVKNSPRF